jgi:hypothetical protein
MDEETGARLPSFSKVGQAVSEMLAAVGHYSQLG